MSRSRFNDDERRKVTEFLKAVDMKENSLERRPADGENHRTVEQALRESSHQQGLLRPGFSRSAVTYVEREDPARKHCEQIIFTVNLSEEELQYPLDPDAAERQVTDDGRSLRRLCWDNAVNAMSEVLVNSGLRPKSLKNDRNSCRLSVQKEYIVPGETKPDEYYTLQMEYLSQGELESRKLHYVRSLARFALDIEERKQRLYGRFVTRQVQKDLVAEVQSIENQRAAFIASNPDPRELDAGLVLHVEVSTPREYGTTKDRMKLVLSEFITALSRIAGGHVKLVSREYGFSLPGRRTTVSVAQSAQILRAAAPAAGVAEEEKTDPGLSSAADDDRDYAKTG